MILKEYDIGWGKNWPVKQFEQEVVNRYVHNFRNDTSRTVIINSVWYTGDYHQTVIAELKQLNPTHIIVVAMIDPPVIDLSWFDEFNCTVVGLGYYPNSEYVDFFALVMDRFYNPVLTQDQLLDSNNIDTPFMCLNRKPHPHRLRLYRGLENAGILDNGFVSMGGNPVPLRLLDNDCDGQDIAPNAGKDQYGIANDVVSLGNTNNWQRHLVNIVTETTWDVDRYGFFSEKTFKPILGLRPFLIYAPNGGADTLKIHGFESYVDDFRDLLDVDLREPYNIAEMLHVLCRQPAEYFKMKFEQLKEKLLFNQNRFNIYVKERS